MPDSGKDAEDLIINPDDFKSTRVTVELKNTFTQTQVKRTADIQIVEFLERGMVLQVPARCCQKGHYLDLDFQAQVPGRKKPQAFKTGARVEDHEALDDASARITVSLAQYDTEEWEKLQSLFSSRQEEIENFFRAAKGY